MGTSKMILQGFETQYENSLSYRPQDRLKSPNLSRWHVEAVYL